MQLESFGGLRAAECFQAHLCMLHKVVQRQYQLKGSHACSIQLLQAFFESGLRASIINLKPDSVAPQVVL